MITRTIQGIPFRVISPSFYELVEAPAIDISFVGDCWFLHVPRTDGSPMLERFESLDEAVAYVALAL